MAVRTARIAALAATLVSSAQLLLAPPPVAAGGPTCDHAASNHRVKAVLSNGGNWISRSISDHILLNGVWCDGEATVYNTDSIVVLAGAGGQGLQIRLDYGGFKPGFTDEPHPRGCWGRTTGSSCGATRAASPERRDHRALQVPGESMRC